MYLIRYEEYFNTQRIYQKSTLAMPIGLDAREVLGPTDLRMADAEKWGGFARGK
jgi:hypothetical protein